MRWLSAAVLVAVNLIPLIGVAFWDWSLMMILVLYWIESGIVGVVNVFKIARAEGPIEVPAAGSRVTIRMSGVAAGLARGGIIGFFILHYGLFWLVHGVFVFLLPVFAGPIDGWVGLRAGRLRAVAAGRPAALGAGAGGQPRRELLRELPRASASI